jgi:hypothetical protein
MATAAHATLRESLLKTTRHKDAFVTRANGQLQERAGNQNLQRLDKEFRHSDLPAAFRTFIMRLRIFDEVTMPLTEQVIS